MTAKRIAEIDLYADMIAKRIKNKKGIFTANYPHVWNTKLGYNSEIKNKNALC